MKYNMKTLLGVAKSMTKNELLLCLKEATELCIYQPSDENELMLSMIMPMVAAKMSGVEESIKRMDEIDEFFEMKKEINNLKNQNNV